MIVKMYLQRGWLKRYEELLGYWYLGMEYPMKLIEKKKGGALMICLIFSSKHELSKNDSNLPRQH